MVGDTQMDNGLGMNAPIVLAAFATGVWATLTAIVNPIVASIIVGIVLKGLDLVFRKAVRAWLVERKLYWRAEARRLRREVMELKRRAGDAD